MSRGMQQKVAIARALLTSPTLLLLDEPTTGLDPRSKLDVQAFIEEVNAAHDATIVLTTHDLAEAERLCSRITILDGGRVVAEDTPEGLKRLVAEVARAGADARVRVHDLHRPLPRRGRRGGRGRRLTDNQKGGAAMTMPRRTPKSTAITSPLERNDDMQHIELRLADVGERQQRFQADRDAERAALGQARSSLRRSASAESLVRLGRRVGGEPMTAPAWQG